MKEKEFINKVWNLRLGFTGQKINSIMLPVYYTINKKGDVVLDEEGMQEEFNEKLKKVKKLLK